MRTCATRILSTVLTIVLCLTPELVFAASGQNPNQDAQPPVSTQPDAATSQTDQQSPATVPENPQPAQTTSPDSNRSTQAAPPGQQPSQPEGTATARGARTIGGPASKPAGSAIAPAKQRQSRSLLIKVGAILGAGAAIGAVYALTRGTPSKPPGAR